MSYNIFKLVTTLIFSLSLFSTAFTQEDSIIIEYKIQLKSSQTIKEKAKFYYELSENYGFKNLDSSLVYAQKLVNLYNPDFDNDTSFIKLIANGYNNIGVLNRFAGKTENTFSNLFKAAEMLEIINDKPSLIETYDNISIIYSQAGNYSKSLAYRYKVLKLSKEINDFERLISITIGIADLYKEINEQEKAEELYLKAIDDIETKKNNLTTKSLAKALNNYGILKKNQGDNKLAIALFERANEVSTLTNDMFTKSFTLANIGSIYHENGDFQKAKEYLYESTALRKKYNMKRDLASSYNNIARLQKNLGNSDSTLFYGNLAFELAKEINSPSDLMMSSELLYHHYKNKNDFKKSLEFLEILSSMRIIDKEKKYQKDIFKQQYDFEYKQKFEQDSIQKLKETEIINLKHQQEVSNQKRNTFMSLTGLFIAILIGGILFVSIKKTKKKNEELTNKNEVISFQKSVLEDKNQEIRDSIIYAKRIQNAILPSLKLVKECLPQSFILYTPKDIVAGDFYWLETSHNPTLPEGEGVYHPSGGGGTILFAAADCTGHGVPGAMVSVVCNNGLNRSVREHGLTNPGKILDKTKEIVMQEFDKSEEDVKDGMDISLCSLELSENYAKLQWAGANNPLWIIRAINSEMETNSLANRFELLEYKGDKQPIGKYSTNKPFTTHSIELQKGDSIYVFTDGFADQFGGEKGKKLMYKPFKELLLSIQKSNMDEQKEILVKYFESWKGTLEQVDDVCIVGVRI